MSQQLFLKQTTMEALSLISGMFRAKVIDAEQRNTMVSFLQKATPDSLNELYEFCRSLPDHELVSRLKKQLALI